MQIIIRYIIDTAQIKYGNLLYMAAHATTLYIYIYIYIYISKIRLLKDFLSVLRSLAYEALQILQIRVVYIEYTGDWYKFVRDSTDKRWLSLSIVQNALFAGKKTFTACPVGVLRGGMGSTGHLWCPCT